MIFLFMLTLLVLFDRNTRYALGAMMSVVMYPLIGFGGRYPVLTLTLGGVLMTLISIVVRHRFTNWVKMAELEEMNREVQKMIKEARLKGNKAKEEKLMEQQKKIAMEQMLYSTDQMKSTFATMLVIIAIFTWLAVFVASLPNKTFSTPWASNVSFLRGGVVLGIVPMWIWVYSLVTIPLGQVIQKVLKSVEFKKRLAEIESEENGAKKESKKSGKDEGVEG